jgi:hypothetical protein
MVYIATTKTLQSTYKKPLLIGTIQHIIITQRCLYDSIDAVSRRNDQRLGVGAVK